MELDKRNVPSLTRRELLRVGGISLVGGFLNTFRPLNVRAQQNVKPMATARQVIFINLEGGMSQVDSLDAREGAWTPNYFDIRSFAGDLKMPAGVFKNLPGVLDKVTVVRSLAAWDAVHGRAQYYIQTGHPLNLALAKEVPSIGAVVCHELAKERKPTDSLPAYIAMNSAGNQAGLINQGFLSAEFGPLSLTVDDGPPNLAPQKGMEETFRRRWERLQQLDQTLRGGSSGLDRSYADYHEYYRGAHAIMNDKRVPEILKITDEDKKRYGGTPIGNSLVLARNLLHADAGTRFILANHGGWDHHGNIYKENTRNHPVLMREFDVAFSSLIKDLDSTPSKHSKGKTLLDETLVIAMGEFGRTPGQPSETRAGREHYIQVHSGMFAGGGMKRGAVIGKTDEHGGKVVESGWQHKRPIYMEDIACTIYSAFGIDWTKTIENTPSGRSFHYVEPASGTKYVGFEPVQEFFA
ncbi:MAG: DUF1501 domain-containing protein [Acidobacteriota bacterium]|nr:DUF1501 domain-containing protein [Acidobacteriota bacterium]